MTRFPLTARALLSASALALLALGCSGASKKNPAGPDLASFAPAQGTIATIVTISGAGFSGTPAAPPTVTFTPAAGGAGYPAQVLSVSATGVDVVVPTVSAADAAAGTSFAVTVANPGGGSTTTPHAFTMAAPTVADVNGGLVGSGSPNSPFILDGESFGDLSQQTTGFSVDFHDATSGNVVASAPVAFASGDWTDIYVVAAVPSTLATGTTYQLTVTTPSGTSAPRSFTVLGAVPFSPSTIQWTATASLPAAQQGFSTVVATIGSASYVYAFGGNIAAAGTSGGDASNVSTVSFDKLDAATGALADTAWTATTALPDQRGFAAAIVADAMNSVVPGNGNVYVLGGLDGDGKATSTVYHAALAADGTIPAAGTLGTWATTTALPQPLFAASAVLFHGRVYVAGGNDATGTPVAKVYCAKVLPDGSLAPWQTLPDLPAAVAYHQLVTAAGNLFVLGGDTAKVDPITNAADLSGQTAIYSDPIDIRSGELVKTTWATNTASLGKAREKFTAVVAGSYVLVSGGLYAGASTGSSEQSYAQVQADGSLGAFNGATGVHTIAGATSGYDFYNHAAAYFVDASGAPHVLVLGGADVGTGAVHDGVWYQH